MNLRTMTAALTVVGAACVAATCASAQQSALEAKIGTETAAPRAGALPMPALKLGEKGVATEQAMQATAPNSAAKKLTIAPSTDVPIENR